MIFIAMLITAFGAVFLNAFLRDRKRRKGIDPDKEPENWRNNWYD